MTAGRFAMIIDRVSLPMCALKNGNKTTFNYLIEVFVAQNCSSFFFSASQQPNHGESDSTKYNNDWVFLNYTYKRFEGLTQRGQVRPSTFNKN